MKLLLFSFSLEGTQLYFIQESCGNENIFRLPTINDIINPQKECFREEIEINGQKVIFSFYSGSFKPDLIVIAIFDFSIPILEGKLLEEDLALLQAFAERLFHQELSRETFPILTRVFGFPGNIMASRWFIKFNDELEKGNLRIYQEGRR